MEWFEWPLGGAAGKKILRIGYYLLFQIRQEQVMPLSSCALCLLDVTRSILVQSVGSVLMGQEYTAPVSLTFGRELAFSLGAPARSLENTDTEREKALQTVLDDVVR